MDTHPIAVDPDVLAQEAHEAEIVRRELMVEEVPASRTRPSAGTSSTPSVDVGPTLLQQRALIPAFLRTHANVLEQLGMYRERLVALRLASDIDRVIKFEEGVA